MLGSLPPTANTKDFACACLEFLNVYSLKLIVYINNGYVKYVYICYPMSKFLFCLLYGWKPRANVFLDRHNCSHPKLAKGPSQNTSWNTFLIRINEHSVFYLVLVLLEFLMYYLRFYLFFCSAPCVCLLKEGKQCKTSCLENTVVNDMI